MSAEDNGTRFTGRYQVFDFHLHALPMFLLDILNGAADDDLNLFRQLWQGDIIEPCVLDETIERMDANNVRQGLLSGNNKMVQHWIERYPHRFFASFTPDFEFENHQVAAKRFEKGVEEGKWHAFGELMLPHMGRPLNDPILFPYYQVCERKGFPAVYHSGFTGQSPHLFVSPYRFRVELGYPLLLQDIVENFPKLKIVISHMGWPFFDQALYMLYTYPNVYLDTSAVNWFLGASVFERMLKEAVETAGSQHILFGSDQMLWPEKIAQALKPIVTADYLTNNDKGCILWDNAIDLLADVMRMQRCRQRINAKFKTGAE